MALKDCTFFVDVNGKQVEMDYDQFRSYLLDGTNLSALAPTLARKKGAKAGFETVKAAPAEKKPAAKATAAPVAGQVETVTAEPGEAKRIADSVGKQKVDAQGFTPPQREFLVEKTQEVYRDIQEPSTPSKYVIKVPGDGQFTITSPSEANGLHRRLTGQNVPGAISKHTQAAPPISKAENLGARGDAYSNLFNPIRTAFTGLAAGLFTKDVTKKSKSAPATPAGLETAPESGLYPLAQHRAEAGTKNVSTDKDFITDGSILVLTSAMSSGKAEKVKAASEAVRRPDASKVRQVWTDAVNDATVPAEIAGVWQSSTAEGLALIDTPNGLITLSPERLNAAVKMTNADGIMISSNATAANPVILTRNGQPVGMIAPFVYKTREATEKAVAGAREAIDEMRAEGKSPASLSANLSKPTTAKPVATPVKTQAAPSTPEPNAPQPVTVQTLQDVMGINKSMAEAVMALYKALGIPLPKIRLAKGVEAGGKELKQEVGKNTFLQKWKATRLMPVRMAVTLLGENLPDHIQAVAEFMMQQRDRFMNGKFGVRDIAKAYIITVSSIQARSQHIAGFEAKTGLKVPKEFLVYNAKGEPMIRPEDAVGYWLLTPQGKKALDSLEATGKVNQRLWKPLIDMRQVFGNNTLRQVLTADPASTAGQYNLNQIREITDIIKGTKGDVKALDQAVRSFRGIAEAKSGFIQHLLGFGSTATVDAREINYWVTGQKDIGQLTTPASEMARAAKEAKGADYKAVTSRIQRQIDRVASNYNLDPNVAAHVIHHWLWDATEGTATTHEGMMKAQRLAQETQKESGLVRGSIYFNSKTEQAQMDGVLAIIRGFSAANVTTPIHEGAHFYRRFMLNTENGFTAEEIKAAEDWAGAKNGKWSVKAEEKWARGFERYLRSGEAPLPSLAKLFEKMAKWFQSVYKVVAGSPIDVEITPEIKRVFDRMFELRADKMQASKGPQTLKQEVEQASQVTPVKTASDLDKAALKWAGVSEMTPAHSPKANELMREYTNLLDIIRGKIINASPETLRRLPDYARNTRYTQVGASDSPQERMIREMFAADSYAIALQSESDDNVLDRIARQLDVPIADLKRLRDLYAVLKPGANDRAAAQRLGIGFKPFKVGKQLVSTEQEYQEAIQAEIDRWNEEITRLQDEIDEADAAALEGEDVEFAFDDANMELEAAIEHVAELEQALRTFLPPTRQSLLTDRGQFKTGKPALVTVYHGTDEAGIKGNAFASAFSGELTGAASAKRGYFFAGSPITPWRYARTHMVRSNLTKAGKVFKFFVKLRNPLVYDMQGEVYRDVTYADLMMEASRKGHDGVIILNTFDGATLDTIFTVLHGYENQIKSAEPKVYNENKQEIPLSERFSESTNILYQEEGPSGETKAPVWRSNIVEALGDWKQNKGTPAQLMAHLNKTKGAAEEAKWIGLNEFLQDKPTVTRAQIEDFVSKNPYIVSDTTIKEGIYSGYTLFGGSNYREIVLTSPKVPFTSGHFGNVPNYLAHMRVKNFKDSEGRKVLLVEEAQSDLHQKARKEGYKTPENQRRLVATSEQISDLEERLSELDGQYDTAISELGLTLAEQLDRSDGLVLASRLKKFVARVAKGTPRAPLRRQATVTAERLSDFVRYQLPRYSDTQAGETLELRDLVAKAGLRKDLNKLIKDYQKQLALGTEYERVRAEKRRLLSASTIPDAPFKGSENWGVMVFKRAIRMAVEEGADVVAWTPGKLQEERYQHLGGDLSTFYDKILPTALGKFVRQWGGKVETVDLTPSRDSKESLRQGVTDELRGQIRYFETRLEEASDEGYDDEGRTTEEILHELNELNNSLGQVATASDAELNRMLSELPAGPGAAFYEQTPHEGFPAIVITPQMKGEAEKGFTLFQAEGVPEDKKSLNYAEIGRKIAERRAELAKKAKEGQAAAPPQPSARQQARPTGATRRPLKVKPPKSLEEMLSDVEKDIRVKAGKASRTSQEEANYRADREVRSLLREYALKTFQGRFGDELELPDGTKVSRRAELLSAIAELQAILKDPALRQNQRLIDRAKVYRRIDYALLAPPKVSKKINPSLRSKLTGHAWGEWSPRSPLSYAQYIGSYERLAGATGRDVSDTFNMVRTMFARGQYRNFAGAMSDLRLRLRPLKDQLREQGYHGLPALIDAHVERLEDATRNIGELTWANVKKAWDENPVNLVSTLAKAFIFNAKLRFSVKSMFLNFIQPLSTLYPYFTASELADLYKRSLTKSEIERVRAIAIAESGGRFTQEMREGVKSRLPNPFQRSSEQVRIMGHLAGEMLADRDKMQPGIERDMFIRSWAEKAEFDNSPWNIGPLFSGPIASVLLQFKPFMFKNLERFATDIRPYKTDKSWITARQAKVILTQLGIGGMSSLMTLVPVVGTALIGPGMLALLAKSLGAMADDDELGEQLAEAFYYGAPSLFGVDLSSSVEFISEPMGKTAAEQVLNVIGGPLVATSVSAYTQGKDMVSLAMRPQKVGEKEEVDKKLREKAMRLSKSITPLAGMAEAAAGLATGNRPTMFLNEKEPYTTGETARKMFGFTPLRQTIYYDRKESPGFIQKFAGRQPDVPGITREKGETDATYRIRVQRVEEYRKKYGDQLLAHPRYKTLDEETKQKALEIINGNISTESAKKRPDVRNLNPLYVMRRAKESVRQAPRREKKQLYVPPDED